MCCSARGWTSNVLDREDDVMGRWIIAGVIAALMVAEVLLAASVALARTTLG